MPDPISAIIGGGASIIGGLISGDAASDAASSQANAANQAAKLQYSMFKQGREDLAPWRAAGENALTQMQKLQKGNYKSFYQSPAYKWNLEQGLQGVQRGASATGRLGSGAYLKDVTKYAEGLASNEFNNFYNRWQNMAQMGQAAASQQATNALQSGQNIGQNYLQAGQAQAAGNLGAAYPWSQMLNQGAGQAFNYGVGQNYMNQLANQNALGNYWQNAQYTPAQMNTMSWL